MITTDSTLLNTSRYVHGGTTEKSTKFLEWWERRQLPKNDTDIIYEIERIYEGRLDLISYVFYKEWRYWWIIAQYNSIIDPTNEIVEGAIIAIPSPSRLKTEFLRGKMGGVSTQRVEEPKISPILV